MSSDKDVKQSPARQQGKSDEKRKHAVYSKTTARRLADQKRPVKVSAKPKTGPKDSLKAGPNAEQKAQPKATRKGQVKTQSQAKPKARPTTKPKTNPNAKQSKTRSAKAYQTKLSKKAPVDSIKESSPFAEFGLATALLRQVEMAGFQRPTPIQKRAIPAIQNGRDVLAQAETGSGKTAAYVLPLINAWLQSTQQREQKRPYHRQSVSSSASAHTKSSTKPLNPGSILVLVPTRELALQIRNEFRRFANPLTEKRRLKCIAVYGGVEINDQETLLRRGADVLIATPARLLDLIKRQALRLNQFRTLVIDEVDRLISDNFKSEVETVLKQLPAKRQNLMFTATFPESIRELVRQVLNQPEIINLEAATRSRTEQHVYTVNHQRKSDLLGQLLSDEYRLQQGWRQVLVFCSTKRSCDKLVDQLAKQSIQSVALHGNKPQSERETTTRDFRSGKIRILIATDVAARGLDIPQLPCVINYELPRSPNDYEHRIGRTGRAGKPGMALTLIAHHEFAHFGVIEKRNGLQLEREQIAGFEADREAPPPPAGRKNKTRNKKRANARHSRSKTTADKRNAASKQAPDKPSTKPSTQDKRTRQSQKTGRKTRPVNADIWGGAK